MSLGKSVCISPLNRSELTQAICQNAYRGRFSDAEAKRARVEFLNDCAGGIWTSVEFPEKAWETCIRLAESYGFKLGMRTLDSLHVACALELKADQFWTFDERQARLAEAAGISTAD
jgi:predicted nucleic acid-binding protein